MNIEQFINDYLKEHRHEVLLNPYNGLIEFAKAFQEKLMGEQMMKDGNVILAEEDFEAEKEKSMEWGYNLCKEQMMKEAVEGEITKDNRGNNVLRVGLFNNGFEIGDKVRVIVLPQGKLIWRAK